MTIIFKKKKKEKENDALCCLSLGFLQKTAVRQGFEGKSFILEVISGAPGREAAK